jgi:hypothetical protein
MGAKDSAEQIRMGGNLPPLRGQSGSEAVKARGAQIRPNTVSGLVLLRTRRAGPAAGATTITLALPFPALPFVA